MMFVRFFTQTVVSALGQIWVNKLRAVLTALGIIIGVGSITAVIAALEGMKTNILTQFESFGSDTMWIWGEVPRELRGKIQWSQVRITVEQVEALQEHCQTIETLTPVTSNSWTIENGDVALAGIQVTAFRPEWHDIERRYVIQGRQFSSVDEETRRQVCLVNEQAVNELRLDRDPVGDYITVDRRRFMIIGILETKDSGGMLRMGDAQTEVFVPFSTALKMNQWTWPYLMAKIKSPDLIDDAKAEVRFIMRKARELEPGTPDTFGIQVLQNAIDQFKKVASSITLVAGGIVAVSLLVGGIGIMNIMLVSVSERTREIGLRKAVGARPGVIMIQFLVEAVLLCVVGGAIGIVVGQGLTVAMQLLFPDTPFESAEIPAWAILLAFAFSGSVGIIFGIFPAIKAALLNPISALRKD